MPLHLTRDQLDSIIAHARREVPNECCGLLVGETRGEAVHVHEVHAVANVWPGERGDRFELDPRAHLRLQRQTRERGLSIVGFYHSHPTSPPIPSAFDRELAWPEQSYLIVSLLDGAAPPVRSWRLDEREVAFVEETIVVAAG